MKLGGTCDQLKMPSLMIFEKVCRRFQLIVEAHAEVGQAPSWKMARYHNGVSTLTDVVSPALRPYGTLRAKEEPEVGFTRVRQLQGDEVKCGGVAFRRGGRGRGSLDV